MASKQNWTTGQTVKVGFLKLTVLGWNISHREWALEGANGKLYSFKPYEGLAPVAMYAPVADYLARVVAA